MADGSRLDFKIIAQPYSSEQDEFVAVLFPTATTAELASATSRQNTVDKFEGRMCWDSTLGEPVYATGAAAADPWATARSLAPPPVPAVATTAELVDETADINTTGKLVGKVVYETTLDLLYAANGTGINDTWTLIDGLGLTVVTPV